MNNELLASQPDSILFFELLDKLNYALSCYGITVKTRSPSPHFDNLRQEEKSSVLKNINTYIDILNSCTASPSESQFDQRFIWSAFKSLNLLPNDDIWKYYHDGCVVEFYDINGVQLFRNFNFFYICSYSLEDIFTRPWFELYSRDPNITDAIIKSSSRLFLKEVRHTIPTHVPDHDLIEINSMNKNHIKMHLDKFVPLKSKDTGEIIVAVIEKCEVLKSSSYNLKNASTKDVPPVLSIS